MFSSRFLRTCLAGGMLASASFYGQANLLTNGDFELNIADIAGPVGFTTVNAGDPLITGWTVGGTSVDLILGNYGAITSVSIDLDGTPGPGSISQTFNQVAGETYALVWDYFRNPPGSNLGVKFGELGPITYTNVSALGSPTTESLTYVATTTGTTSVTFSSSGGYGGPTLDNVSVTAVPEPEGVAMALLGFGMLGAVRARRSKS